MWLTYDPMGTQVFNPAQFIQPQQPPFMINATASAIHTTSPSGPCSENPPHPGR